MRINIKIALYNPDYTELLADLFESSEPVPVPSVGDVIKIKDSKYYKVTDRAIVYEDSGVTVTLTGELDESVIPPPQG